MKSAVTWLGGGSWWRVVLGTAVLYSWWLSGDQQAEILRAMHIRGGEEGGKREGLGIWQILSWEYRRLSGGRNWNRVT